MRLRRSAIATALFVAMSSTLWAQTVSKSDMVKASATIQAIDSTTRMITVKAEDGDEMTIWAPQEMARFSELKVGDRVNLTYYESTVYQLRKPGATSNKPSDRTEVVPTTGSNLPGGAASRQVTTTVTVKSVDPSAPSITVTTADGRTVTRKIAQKSHLDGVSPGDRIDITYTEAILASVERK